MKIKLLLILSVFSIFGFGQNINFPDANFKSKLVNQTNPTIDTNQDDEISVAEATAFTGRLKIEGNFSSRISDLTGIEYFINATEIRASNNELTTVDLSSNVSLIDVDFYSNDLVSIDFSNNTALEVINVSSNNLLALDVSSNVNLRELGCTNMQMTSLNVTGCTQLEELSCAINQFTSIDLSTNTALKTYFGHSIPLASIDLSNNLLLETLNCSSNAFSTLDVSNNTLLTTIDCSYGQVTDIVFSPNNTLLTTVECQQSPLTTLDVSDLPGLTHLILNDNQITSLDVSQNTTLQVLELDDNQMTTIDLESNPNLNTFKAERNLLQSVYLRNGNNSGLGTLRLQYNPELYCLFVDNSSISYGNWYRGGAVSLVETEAECTAASQVTIIPDIKFEQELISLGYDTSPSNGETPTIKINTITDLDVHSSQITDLTGIQDFTALEDLDCSYNPITTLDVSNNTNLIVLDASYNDLISVNFGANPNLRVIRVDYNELNNVDLSQLPDLVLLDINDNNLTSLDVTNNLSLRTLNVFDNPLPVLDIRNNNIRTMNSQYTQIQSLDFSNSDNINILYINNNNSLEYINFKSGDNDDIQQIYSMSFTNLPNLTDVCVDDVNSVLALRIQGHTSQDVNITEDCLNEISGTISYDMNNDGCDVNDLAVSNLLIESTSVVDETATISSASGSYVNYVRANDYATTIQSSLPGYFVVTPITQSSLFTDFNQVDTVDFCITSTGDFNDVTISVYPLDEPRPGFDSSYQLVYSNVGSTQLSGFVDFEYDNTKLQFLSATETVDSQTSNHLVFNYVDLNPFETRTITLNFNVFAPPTVEIDDVLSFTATIDPVLADETDDDNVFNLEQTVIGSYDPNDIQVIEGDQIYIEDIDKYLHYIIRFQNTGTASAINVRVNHVLDEKLDFSTLQLESMSHDGRVEINDGNNVDFIFNNINLPDSTTDEPNSHGYIAFKIKPKQDVVIGDIINGVADIYFDFNPPITTNIVSTEIVETLSVVDVSINDFKIYPNPAESIVTIQSETPIDAVSVYDINGRLLNTIEVSNPSTDYQLQVEDFNQGLYFLEIKSGSIIFKHKFIKR